MLNPVRANIFLEVVTEIKGILSLAGHTSRHMAIKKYIFFVIALSGFCVTASADVWRWVDLNGNTHFVDTARPIYSWRDPDGKVHFSDQPEHADAVSVELTWHSAGTLRQHGTTHVSSEDTGKNQASPQGETYAERRERKKEEQARCDQAADSYDFFVHAKRLFVTNEDGEKEYLSADAAAAQLAEMKGSFEKYCN